jgi:hypothetical protein
MGLMGGILTIGSWALGAGGRENMASRSPSMQRTRGTGRSGRAPGPAETVWMVVGSVYRWSAPMGISNAVEMWSSRGPQGLLRLMAKEWVAPMSWMSFSQSGVVAYRRAS